jgi:hypothetical protein|tara:strand:+ start:65 stop:274 length:210 start_codon:yes stop_codon:yes gene_type:complete
MITQTRALFSINEGIKFTTIDGQVFGIDGDQNYIDSLTSAALILLSDSAARSINLVNGDVIRFIHRDLI